MPGLVRLPPQRSWMAPSPSCMCHHAGCRGARPPASLSLVSEMRHHLAIHPAHLAPFVPLHPRIATPLRPWDHRAVVAWQTHPGA